MPRWVWGAMPILTMLAIIPFVQVFKSRATHSPDPHYHVFSDMDFQNKVKSDVGFDEFPSVKPIDRDWMGD